MSGILRHRPPSIRAGTSTVLLLIAGTLGLVIPGMTPHAYGQQVDSLPPDPVLVDRGGVPVPQELDEDKPGRPSPGGAFLRSLVLPGWGQVASGSYSRAVFYVLLESSSAYMLVKTQRTLEAAQDRAAFREAAATRHATEAGLSDPDSIQAFVDGDEGVEDARALVEARSQQREDWLAFGLAMLLLGGADAFVSAHLSDFPDALTVEARGLPGGAYAAEIRVGLPWSPEWLGGRRRGN